MRMTLAERLLAKSVRDNNGCLRWTGSHNPKGYGMVRRNGKMVGVHRAAYEQWRAPIPEGLEVDHLCNVRDCMEPSHLEAVTHHENVLRSNNLIAVHARKTHCVHGHPLPPYQPGQRRRCDDCLVRDVDCPECGIVVRAMNLPRHIRRNHK